MPFFFILVVAGSRPDEAAVRQGALQAHSPEGREDWEGSRSATQRAQCREVQDSHAWKVRGEKIRSFILHPQSNTHSLLSDFSTESSRRLVRQLCHPIRTFLLGWTPPLRWGLYLEQEGGLLVGKQHDPWALVAQGTAQLDGMLRGPHACPLLWWYLISFATRL